MTEIIRKLLLVDLNQFFSTSFYKKYNPRELYLVIERKDEEKENDQCLIEQEGFVKHPEILPIYNCLDMFEKFS